MSKGAPEKGNGVESFSGALGSNVDTLEQMKASLPLPIIDNEHGIYVKLCHKILAAKGPDYDKKPPGKAKHFQSRVDAVEQALFNFQNKENLSDNQKKLLENIRGMLLALAALSRNQAKYTENYLISRLNDVLKEVPEPSKTSLFNNLRSVVDYNVLKGPKIRGGKKSISFDAQQPAMQGAPADKRAKRLKIEHATEDASGNKIVKVTFSYDRTRLFGKSTGSKIGNRAKKYEEFQEQISHSANILMYEYGKGVTQDKPLTISYTDFKQPEAALALLLEYKKRAIEQKKTFYAIFGKEKIEITPNDNFSESEKRYFLHYANSQPEIPNRNGKPRSTGKCAGYCLLELENEGAAVSKANKQAITEDDLNKLLQKRLPKEKEEETFEEKSSPPNSPKGP